jgi:hypothetical protein
MRAIVGLNDIKMTYWYIISNMVYPLSLLFVVSILSNTALLPYALAGGIVSVLAINGISLAAAIAPMKSDYKYKDLIVSTKTSPAEYLFGEITAQFLWSMPSLLIFLAMDIYFGILSFTAFGVSILVGILITFITSSIAFWITGIMRNTTNIWAISIILSFFLVTIAPTFYPYTYLHGNVLSVMMFLPTTSAAMLEQAAFGLAPMSWYPVIILVVETIVFLIIAVYFTKWRED